ncbi:helix-turn-helix domain-containing protein [Anaerotignum faecicola]|nr:helix-turn-helix domain-containing protein [Anaerotignum faecicola]
MMKDLYSIGEVAKIMGVSIQTLRYYSSINLLHPIYTNSATGYRYYSVNQLHFIDRIKYLQKLGLSLEEIKKVILNNDIKELVSLLDKHKSRCIEEISKLYDVIDSIEWYKNYFTYINEDSVNDNFYSLHIEKRYLVAVPYEENKNEEVHIKLHEIKNSDKFRTLRYFRQFSLILDYDSLMECKLDRKYLGMFIKEPPKFESEHIIEIPEGDYLCFKARILSETWNPYFAKLFFSGKKSPSIVLAIEYEDNLYEYSRCVYEVQMLINS